MGPLEQRLEQVAKRVGWRFRWKSENMRAYPKLVCTELDIYEGKRLVTAQGPAFVIHGGRDDRDAKIAAARESVAGMVLAALPRRGTEANR